MKKFQEGFSAIEGLLIVVIVGMLGGVGYYVWHANSQANKSYSQTANSSAVPSNKSSSVSKAPEVLPLSIDSGTVQFTPSDLWKVEENPSPTAKSCGLAVTSSEKCNDSKILTLKSENNFFTYSTDSFNVNITSFSNSGKNLKDWLDSALDDNINAQINSKNAEYKELTINGVTAARYAVKPDPSTTNRLDVYYAVVTPTKVAVVSTELFKGDHYSFKNSTDYNQYSSDLDTLAKTIKIKG
jgi:hypothetical protein